MSQKKASFLKLSILASAIALTVSGCNENSETVAQEGSQNSEVYSVQAIDGYLVNAEVWADVDGSHTITDGDIKLGTTGENGKLDNIAASNKNYPIIIKAIAGQTYDTDKVGTLSRNLELIAGAGDLVVTPFSTYAVKTSKTLKEVAKELNIDLEFISTDYVAKKSSSDTTTTNSATKAHLAARSIAGTLTESLDDTDKAGFQAKVLAIKAAVDSAFENAADKSDLDDLLVELDDNNTASTTKVFGTLKETMLGKGYYGYNTNESYFTDEGSTIIYFNDAANEDGTVGFTINIRNVMEEGVATFSSDGYSIQEDGNTSKETIIYYGKDEVAQKAADEDADEFLLQVTNDGDMFYFITNHTPAASDFDKTRDITNQTYYVLFDGSTTTSVDVTMAEMVFGEDNTVKLTEGGASKTHTWDIVDGALVVDDVNDNGSAWSIKLIAGNDDMNIVVETSDNGVPGLPYVMVKNKIFATSLFNRWMKLQ